MDVAVIKYFRKLVKIGYKYAGSFDNPSILLNDESGAPIRICSSIGSYIRIYIKVSQDRITGIKYLCTCDPSTHVAIEILCLLIDGKTLDETLSINVDSFLNELGGASEDLGIKANGLLNLLRAGIEQYRAN